MRKEKDEKGNDRRGKENMRKEKDEEKKGKERRKSHIQHGGTKVMMMKRKMTNVSYHNFFKSWSTELPLAYLRPGI